MTVKEIVFAYLLANGFDGLFLPGECACKLGDLMPCTDMVDNCEPGHMLIRAPDCDPEDFHIGKRQHFEWTFIDEAVMDLQAIGAAQSIAKFLRSLDKVMAHGGTDGLEVGRQG